MWDYTSLKIRYLLNSLHRVFAIVVKSMQGLTEYLGQNEELLQTVSTGNVARENPWLL